MKKYLIAGAALLLSVTGALAGPTTFIKLNGSNDYFAITRQVDTYAQVHYKGTSVIGGGVGMAAMTRDAGVSVVMTDVRTADGSGSFAYICYNFQRPFVNGGTWVAYGSADGKNVQPLGSGTYTILSVHQVTPTSAK